MGPARFTSATEKNKTKHWYELIPGQRATAGHTSTTATKIFTGLIPVNNHVQKTPNNETQNKEKGRT